MNAKGLNKTQRETLAAVAAGEVYLSFTRLHGATVASVRALTSRGLIRRLPENADRREVFVLA